MVDAPQQGLRIEKIWEPLLEARSRLWPIVDNQVSVGSTPSSAMRLRMQDASHAANSCPRHMIPNRIGRTGELFSTVLKPSAPARHPALQIWS